MPAAIAERELAVNDLISNAAASGEFEKLVLLEQLLVTERRQLQAELEEHQDAVRTGGGRK